MPFASDKAKWVYRYTSRDVRPYDVKSSRALAAESPVAAREALGEKHVRTLAREVLSISQSEFSAAFAAVDARTATH